MDNILGKIESMNGWKCYPCPNCPILEERIRELTDINNGLNIQVEQAVDTANEWMQDCFEAKKIIKELTKEIEMGRQSYFGMRDEFMMLIDKQQAKINGLKKERDMLVRVVSRMDKENE